MIKTIHDDESLLVSLPDLKAVRLAKEEAIQKRAGMLPRGGEQPRNKHIFLAGENQRIDESADLSVPSVNLGILSD